MNLFTASGHFTKEAEELTNKAVKALKPVMEEYTAQGYSFREIAHLLAWAAKDVELETALRRLKHEKTI